MREPNPRREHWNGHLLTKDEATAQSGIKTVYYTGEFEGFVTAMFNRRAYGRKRGEVTDDFDAFFAAVAAESRHAGASVRPAPGAVGAAAGRPTSSRPRHATAS